MTQCYALSVLDNVNGFEPLTIELWERDILELAMGFVLLDTKLECNSWNCVQIAEYEDFNKTEKKLKFAILSLSRKARYWQILLHFIKLSAAMLCCIFWKKIRRRNCKIYCYHVLGMGRRWNRHFGSEIDNFLTCQQILRRVFTTNDSKINKKLNKTSLLVDSRLDNDVNIYYQHVYILLYPVSCIRSNRYIDWEWQSRNYINF